MTQVVAPVVVKKDQIELYSNKFYLTCALGGATSCGLTHTFVTPMDVVKCRMQVNPKIYKGVFDGWRQISNAYGVSGLYLAWGPTLAGYSIQGACKFGLYELFKKKYPELVGEDFAHRNRTLVYLAASASAEVFADIGLCPFEAAKVRMQTSATPFASNGIAAMQKIAQQEGVGALFKGLTPLWMRQIPYTMMKFAAFERTVEGLYKYALSKPKSSYSKTEQLGVSFLGGYIAGVFCAVVSHPADVVVSKLNNSKTQGESTGQAVKRILGELGPSGVWRGLGPRIIMIGTLTGLQWFIYDTFKVYSGIPTSGSATPAPAPIAVTVASAPIALQH